jgi:ACR3 family arsenite efflux pump ArsB
MMYPILCKVEYEKLHEIFRQREIWVQLGFSIIINWIVAPLLMVSNCTPTVAILPTAKADGRSSASPGPSYRMSEAFARVSFSSA